MLMGNSGFWILFPDSATQTVVEKHISVSLIKKFYGVTVCRIGGFMLI